MGKRISLLMVLVLLVVSLAACTGNEAPASEAQMTFESRSWKVGHVRPEGTSTHDDMVALAEALKKGSEGQLTLEIYPASQLGNYTVVQERVSLGDVEMQLAPLGTSVDKGLGIASAPYLVSNWAEAEEMFSSDGPLMDELRSRLEEQNIRLLAAYPKYFGGIALAVEPESPGDVNVNKGIKIRVPAMKQYELTADALGFIATPIAYSEAFTSMQTGIVDGVIGSGAEGYYSSFRDLTKYYLPLNDHFEMWFLYMNLDLWNELSAEEQALLESEGVKFEENRYAVAEEEQEQNEAMLADLGIVVYDFSDEELAAMKAKIQTEVWPLIKDEFGADLFDKVVGQ